MNDRTGNGSDQIGFAISEQRKTCLRLVWERKMTSGYIRTKKNSIQLFKPLSWKQHMVFTKGNFWFFLLLFQKQQKHFVTKKLNQVSK